MKRITVIISRRASKEIDEAALWWADRGEPAFIDDAIDKVVARLQAFPKSAPVVEIRGKWSDTHRASEVLLSPHPVLPGRSERRPVLRRAALAGRRALPLVHLPRRGARAKAEATP